MTGSKFVLAAVAAVIAAFTLAVVAPFASAATVTGVTVSKGIPTVTWTLSPGEANNGVEISNSPDLWTPSNCVGNQGCINFTDVGGFKTPIAERGVSG